MTKPISYIFFLKFLVFLFLLQSCSFDNEEEFYADVYCDTIDISYTNDVVPILENSCLGCHFAGNSNGTDLETYKDVKSEVEKGSLLGTIKHLPGFVPMPQGGKLDDCSINQIEIWIKEGAQNN